MNETILTNATIVTPDEAFAGTLVLRGERIADVAPGRSAAPGAIDLEGDLLIPGVVDVHTDNLERQVQPRQQARWPSRSAMLAHDAQCAVAGITTVLDALCVGIVGFEYERTQTFRDAVADIEELAASGLFRSEHFLHLRCELPAEDMRDLFEPVCRHPALRMVSLMDHTPGSGQYADLDRYRAMRRSEGIASEEVERALAERLGQRARMREPNRDFVLAAVAQTGVTLASHDDRTEEEVAEHAALGIRVSEFPVTLAAAEAAQAHGMQVIAGAPNVVRGGSHSGNVAAAELIAAATVDALASDYVPASLVEAAFIAAAQTGLARAVAMITAMPAAMAGFDDRGALRPGLRGDLVRVHEHRGLPVLRGTWRAGTRIA
ncbi:MAG: alpha-D-ribose 1-methylphosphonate 5-triphosphate diphosphatase [Rhodospirillales bacterium]|nr:alpha-D-ribose 1-methylphosphonate 5-triphosphate diphosphatase [Rhodospirillales bacterium]